MRSFLLLFLMVPFQLFAQESKGDPISIVPQPSQNMAIEAGFEWGSLYQERFRNLGGRNFSYLLGFRGGEKAIKNFGVRLMGVHVQFTPARARNHQGIDFIADPKEGLEGELNADRLYFDIYPLRFGFIELDSARYAVRAAIAVSPGLGYNSWRVRPENSSTEYLLNGLSLGFALRARLRIMEYFFIEYPFFDLFTLLYQGPSSGKLGRKQRRIDTSPIGVFSWGTIGVSIPLD